MEFPHLPRLKTVADVSCQACPNDGTPNCIFLQVIQGAAEPVPVELIDIAPEQTENWWCGVCADEEDSDLDGFIDDDLECDDTMWP